MAPVRTLRRETLRREPLPPAPRGLRLRSPQETDQFACISLDGSYQAERTWQVDRHDFGDETSVRIRPVRLPRPRRVRPDRDTGSFLQLWASAQPFLVAELDTDLVGWLAARPDPESRTLHLLECVVVPAERRRGIGSALLAECRDEARRAGCEHLRAAVPIHNDPAVRWLQRAGWHLTGWDERHHGDTVALLLSVTL